MILVERPVPIPLPIRFLWLRLAGMANGAVGQTLHQVGLSDPFRLENLLHLRSENALAGGCPFELHKP